MRATDRATYVSSGCVRELSCLVPFAAASAAASVRSLLNPVFNTVLRLCLVCLNHTDTLYGIVLHRVAFMYVLCCATLRLPVAAAGTCIARVAFGIAATPVQYETMSGSQADWALCPLCYEDSLQVWRAVEQPPASMHHD